MMHQSVKPQLSSLLMVRTNTYNDQVIRPFQTTMSSGLFEQVREATRYGEVITSSALAGVAGNILRPQAQAAATIQMHNGWDQHRLRFMLAVTIPMGQNGAVHEVITGYTDHYGTTADGMGMDPNMRLFFNNTVTLNSSIIPHAGVGNVTQMRVAEATHLLMPPPGLSSGSMVDTHTMRPEDVMNVISTSMITDGGRLDMRSNFAMSPVKKSYRANGLAPDYLARTMKAVDTATQIDSSMEHNTLYQEARGILREPLLQQDLFIQTIAHKTRFKECGFITYAELCAVFPETEAVRKMIIPGQAQQQTLAPQRGGSEYWHVPSNESVVATMLSHSVPAIMMDLMLTKVTFHATNATLNGQPDIQIRDHRGFADGMDMTPYVQRFMQRFLGEVMTDLTHSNRFQVDVAMSCNILGDTFIQISLSGGPKIDYVCPSFCDALFSPLLTTDTTALHTLAHDIDIINNNLASYNQNNTNNGGIIHNTNVVPHFGHQSMMPMQSPTQPQGDQNVGTALINAI